MRKETKEEKEEDEGVVEVEQVVVVEDEEEKGQYRENKCPRSSVKSDATRNPNYKRQSAHSQTMGPFL